MRRNVRRMNELDDPTPEEIAAFREVGAAIAVRIRSLETETEAAAQQVQRLLALKATHDKLTCTELATIVDALEAQGDHEGLRALVLELVESAVLVERRPERQSVWARVEVT